MNKLVWLTIVASAFALPLLAQEKMAHAPTAAQGVSTKAAAPTQLDPITVIGRPQPIPRVRMSPHYPMQAKRRWEEGCVILQFTVRPDGKTDDFAILESKPRGLFEKSVIGAVYQWQYDRSKASRTVVEAFEFRNQSLSTQPIYTVRNAVNVPAGYDSRGGRKYHLEMQLQGYQPPKCKVG